ncbi:MAG TPA: PIN domain-containing protein [Thermoanaerobaculia bacterium]|nr:PIN domain-containing protein [Thermoanaerobaculia bacterium]
MRGEAPAFVDTNVLVYAFDNTDSVRHAQAEELLSRLMDEDRLRLSVQVLQEFYVTMTRKARPPWAPDRALAKLEDFAAWSVVANDLSLLREAVLLSRDSVLSFWDALVVAAAARSGAATLYSEDLNDGQVLRGVHITNPFIAQASSGA